MLHITTQSVNTTNCLERWWHTLTDGGTHSHTHRDRAAMHWLVPPGWPGLLTTTSREGVWRVLPKKTMREGTGIELANSNHSHHHHQQLIFICIYNLLKKPCKMFYELHFCTWSGLLLPVVFFCLDGSIRQEEMASTEGGLRKSSQTSSLHMSLRNYV